MRSPREDQERVFRLHIGLARESGKPLVVHVRDAWPDVLRVLGEGSAERVVIHCFSGDGDIARECLARGYYLSFAGNVTYPKNEHLRQAARAAPLDRLLVETDSPFLAPQKLRGSDNEPANVTITLRELAAERGETFETLRDATTANAFAVFGGLQ
jgi:TatD DNase family protein